jgi:hypothetical protein
MKIEFVFFIVNFITLGSLLLSIIYTAGIVWRVEMKLDIAYKFFLSAIIFLSAAEIIGFFPSENNLNLALAMKILQMLFTVCLLLGVFLMRNITRELDGEIKKDEQE